LITAVSAQRPNLCGMRTNTSSGTYGLRWEYNAAPAVAMNTKGLNGGRDRTRTCDLLRVKQAL
jgi:hypothetical protein